MTTRTFTPEQLDEIGVPNELGEDGCATELHREQVDSRRWISVHELIFRAPDDGKAYRVYYQRPLTEHQECDTWPGDEVKAVEVEERPKVITTWEPVTERPTGGPVEPYQYRDAEGDLLHISIPSEPASGGPSISFYATAEPVHVPVAEIEDLIAAVRRLVASQ